MKKTHSHSPGPSQSTYKKTVLRGLALIAPFLISFLVLTLSFARPAIAQTDPASFSKFSIPEMCNINGVECGWNEFLQLGNQILRFAIFLAVTCATVVFIIAGFKMILNRGNSGEIEKAKKMMWTAIWGIVITMSAWLIVDFILDALIPSSQSEFRSLVK